MKNQIQTRQQMLSTIEKRFKTIMIGSLASFEQEFGHLWNHNEDPNTTQEEFFRDKWEEVREVLLDKGNYQIRQGLSDLNNYLNSVEKYHLQVFYNRGE